MTLESFDQQNFESAPSESSEGIAERAEPAVEDQVYFSDHGIIRFGEVGRITKGGRFDVAWVSEKGELLVSSILQKDLLFVGKKTDHGIIASLDAGGAQLVNDKGSEAISHAKLLNLPEPELRKEETKPEVSVVEEKPLEPIEVETKPEAAKTEGRNAPAIDEMVYVPRSDGTVDRVPVAFVYPNSVKVLVTKGLQEGVIKGVPLERVLFVGKEIETPEGKGYITAINEKEFSVETPNGAVQLSTVETLHPPKQEVEASSRDPERMAENPIWPAGLDPSVREFLMEMWPQGVEADFEQRAVGDCYFLAALQTLKSGPDAVRELTDLISKNPDGTFAVTFPGDPEKRTFTVTLQEVEELAKKGLKGSFGERIIERAYARYRRKRVQEEKDAEASGKTVFTERRILGIQLKKMAITGGFPKDAMEDLLGKERYIFSDVPKEGMLDYLKNINGSLERGDLDQGEIKTTLIRWAPQTEQKSFFSRFRKPPKRVTTDATGAAVEMPDNHAYSIREFDTAFRQALIADPHGKKYWLTYPQVAEYFDLASVALKRKKNG